MTDTQKHDKAIVTIIIGEEAEEAFRQYTLPTWEAYAARHGYDIVLLNETIDKECDFSRKSLPWQKLLVGLLPQVQAYEHVVWLDGEVLINHRTAPCIVSALEEDKIGVVDVSGEFLAPDDDFNRHTRYLVLTHCLNHQLNPDANKAVITDTDINFYYRLFGLSGSADRLINTGVLAFAPKTHGRFLAELYAKYDNDGIDFENTPVSFELQEQGMAEYLDARFNTLWAQAAAKHYPFLFNRANLSDDTTLLELCVNIAYRNTWFLHFAGAARNPVVKWAYRMVDPDWGTVPELVFPEYRERAEGDVVFCRLTEVDAKRKEMGEAAKDYDILF